MAEIVTTLGRSTETLCCTECNWFNQPSGMAGTGMVLPQTPVTHCPVCGGDIVEMEGQYKIRTTIGLWGFCNDNEFIDFIRK